MPGQFINSGTNPGGKLSLINSNNGGNLNLSVASPTFYTYQGGFNGMPETLYSADSPLDIGSILYTDSALTTPYPYGGLQTSTYFYMVNSPSSGSISGINSNSKQIVLNAGCDLGSGFTQTAFTYPIAYGTLAEVYANNATLYINYAFNGYPLYGQSTISDGTGYYQYDYTTGKITGVLDSCGNNSGFYCTALGSSSPNDCDACNFSLYRNQYAYHSGPVINVGTTLYTDTSLTTPYGSGYYSDGAYSYAIDGSGIVTSKTLCGTKSFSVSINETNTCGDGTPITLYTPQVPGTPQSGLAGVALYTDCELTTPYTYTGPAHDLSRVYDVVGGVFTYNSACLSATISFGLSDTNAAEACSNFTSSPTTMISGYGSTLNDLVTYQSAIWYASNNQNVTASYISDGVNSYEVVQNYNRNAVTCVVGSPTSC